MKNVNILILSAVIALMGIVALQFFKPAQQANSADLLNSYWALVKLKDQPITSESAQKEPHIILEIDQSRFHGSGGCNSMAGSYTLKGNKLSFNDGIVLTRMACEKGLDIENNFVEALESVDSWSTTDHQLKLYDAQGNVVAEFEQRPMQ